MKEKHIRIRVEQCLALSKASNCPRRKFGALLVDPSRNVVLMDGYNGGPRGGGELCGGDVCLRDSGEVKSGTRIEIGCHHAEMNLICNAAANGVPTRDAWLIVTGEPCTMCSKLIHHARSQKVSSVASACILPRSHRWCRRATCSRRSSSRSGRRIWVMLRRLVTPFRGRGGRLARFVDLPRVRVPRYEQICTRI